MPRSITPVLLVALAACAPQSDSASPATPPQVVFTAGDFSFDGPDSIAPGFTAVRMVNAGAKEHHLILGRLDDGRTLAEVTAYLAEHPAAEPPYLSWRGVAGVVAPGDSSGATVDLTPGKYVLICFVSEPTDPQPHMLKGMIKEVVVAGAPGGAAPPHAESEIRLRDFSFEAPALTAGTHTFHLINDGPQTHEVQLVRLNDGAGIQDYLGAMAPGAKGPPPGTLVGGPGAFGKGLDGYWTVTLTPGKYAFLCFVPDPADGMPHIMKGMVREFSIAAS